MISLVDCNNFYASCERVFQPELEGKPLIILSNNDGCAIARSNEAKALGIKMGAPYFEIKDICKKHGVHVYSSNYTLYGSMSKRVMLVLKDFAVRQEVYSIDECWLDLSGIPDLINYGQQIRSRVKQWTGIPVSVGIGQTKVLAKFANYLAKKHKFLNNVCNLAELGTNRVDRAMQITPVGEVWGIGRKIAVKLQQMGITTVYKLKLANPKQMSKIFSVNIERIIYELNGIKCLELEDCHEPNKQIISSRSFAQAVNSRDALKSSLIYHLEQVSRKMRRQGLFARQMVVFAHTNRFSDDYFSSSVNIVFPAALDSFRYMASSLDKALDVIYKPHIGYKKSGVIINDLITGEYETQDLFDTINIQHDKLMPTLENIKRHFGISSIKLAAAQLSDSWKMQQNLVSNRYTTNINDLLAVN
jgi:DNA polymerase V